MLFRLCQFVKYCRQRSILVCDMHCRMNRWKENRQPWLNDDPKGGANVCKVLATKCRPGAAQGHYVLGGRRTNNKTKDSGSQMVHGLLHPIALVGTATQGGPTTWSRSLLGYFCNSGTNGCSFSRHSMEHWTEQMWNDDVKQASFLTGPAKEIHCKPAAFGPDLLSKAEGNIWRPR